MGTIGRAALRRGVRIGVCLAATLTIVAIVASAAYTAESTSQPAASCAPPQAEPATPAPTPSALSAAPQQSGGPEPEEIVACVGTSTISGATFSHWAAVAQRAGSPHRKPSAVLPHAVMVEVMSFLISSDWVMGEAAELGVTISAAAVRRHFDHLRNEQFPRRGAYRAFLRSTGQTTPDLLLRVRLSMLSTRIQQRVVGHGRNTKRKQRRLSRFVANFERRWKARTSCEARYRIEDCGHVAPTL